MDKPREECGVFGFYDNDGHDSAAMTYYGLFALQHRGQESCGIAVNDGGHIIYHKEQGLVGEVFNEVVLSHLNGRIGLGHVRYGAGREQNRENAQPLVMKYTKGNMALAHSGNIVNAVKLKQEFEEKGFMFQTSLDAEVIAALVSRERIKCHSIEDALAAAMKRIRGAYALLIMSRTKLVAARDPLGMRPLVIGKKGNSFVICSETSALTAVGGSFLRDVRPGEIIVINKDGMRSIHTETPHKTAVCLFEYVYFARTDSVMDGVNVYDARVKAGRILAREHKRDVDAVIGVPDSGVASALGYARESGVPYVEGLVKNRYIGRTFIKPKQDVREKSVFMKLTPIASQIAGKRVVMIDDSIVRGTTSKIIVQILKDAGAKEVHVLASSPPVKHSCYFGIDTSEESTLIANTSTHDEIRETIGADSLGFLSLEGALKTTAGAKCGFCTACFDGNYPLDISEG